MEDDGEENFESAVETPTPETPPKTRRRKRDVFSVPPSVEEEVNAGVASEEEVESVTPTPKRRRKAKVSPPSY